MLMWYMAGHNFRYRCDGRGACACKSDGATNQKNVQPTADIFLCAQQVHLNILIPSMINQQTDFVLYYIHVHPYYLNCMSTLWT